MYFEVPGVSKHKLGGMRDELNSKMQRDVQCQMQVLGKRYLGLSSIYSFQPENAR